MASATIPAAELDDFAHVQALARDRKREERRLMALALPAALVVVVLLVLPVLWLFGLSAFDGGTLTFKHYARVFSDSIYRDSLLLTLKLSGLVTLACFAVGYPLAYMMTQLRPSLAGFCMTLVVIPFWTSLLVRTYAWLVLLQRRGIVNEWLTGVGIVDEPLYLVHNETGAAIGMFHIMLPFFILPLYASMKRIDPELMKASAGLGCAPLMSFWRVYFPLSLPGLMAGGTLVLILCLGFYITPALLGGGKTMMIAVVIERNVNLFFEWGAASSVAVVFLFVVIVLFVLIGRFFSLQRLFGSGA